MLTMRPNRDWYRTTRRQIVTVDHCLGGTVNYDTGRLTPTIVRWAGTGGYWCETADWELLAQEKA